MEDETNQNKNLLQTIRANSNLYKSVLPPPTYEKVENLKTIPETTKGIIKRGSGSNNQSELS